MELTEATASLAPLRILGGIIGGAAALAVLISLPRLFARATSSATDSTQRSGSSFFTIVMLDRALVYLIVAGIVLALLPKQLRRLLIGGCTRLASNLLSGVLRLLSVLLYALSRSWRR
jgi:uncharacterized protein YqhQ